MKLLSYVLAYWGAFASFLESAVGYHKATGTLPAVPPLPETVPAAPISINPVTTPPTLAGFTVIDQTNGLGEFDEVQADADLFAEYAGWSFNFEGAKVLFPADSQAWQTINWNCGEVEFETANPQLNLMGDARAVLAMKQIPKPGSTDLYWSAEGPAILKTHALPNHVKTVPDALAYLRKQLARKRAVLAAEQANGGSETFSPAH